MFALAIVKVSNNEQVILQISKREGEKLDLSHAVCRLYFIHINIYIYIIYIYIYIYILYIYIYNIYIYYIYIYIIYMYIYIYIIYIYVCVCVCVEGRPINIVAKVLDCDLEIVLLSSFSDTLLGKVNPLILCPVCRGVRLHQWMSCCDTKQSDAEIPVMLELWEMWSTPLLPSFSSPLWPGVVAPEKSYLWVK